MHRQMTNTFKRNRAIHTDIQSSHTTLVIIPSIQIFKLNTST